MRWALTKNNCILKLKDIPVINIDELNEEITKIYKEEKHIVNFFGLKVNEGIMLYAILANNEKSTLLVSSAFFEKNRTSYQSITRLISQFHIFEREFYEEFGILPENHPWLKPVRYSHDRASKGQKIDNYPFFKMEGNKIHEVAVGPVHAGIIEPGHFRFMANGEEVYHLEIQLGYQHRGIEKMMISENAHNRQNFRIHLAESIAGDSVIGHASCCASLLEALGCMEISKRAMAVRSIALELERIGIHIGDLGAISNDIAYQTGSAVFGALRTLVINSTLSICGSRFGRGLIRTGGVNFDIGVVLREKIKNTLEKVDGEIMGISELMFSQSSVLSRLEETGILTRDNALKIGMLGPPARASGIAIDTRTDHPFGIYKYHPIYPVTLERGDVFARTFIRYTEIRQSIRFILEILDEFPEDREILNPLRKTTEESMAISMVEGWRGEIAHIALTDNRGRIIKYKIKDPSFCNWFGLALAVRDNGISDFPLCNKSFNLSYCGNDL